MPLPFNELPYSESMHMDRDTVIQLAEENHLAITIRPDGSIFGLPADLDRLRELTEQVDDSDVWELSARDGSIAHDLSPTELQGLREMLSQSEAQ